MPEPRPDKAGAEESRSERARPDPRADSETDSAGASPAPIALCGEVLFDRFEDGHSVLGGATFNVAWNLGGLGLDPLLITRVGADALGERVRRAMESWGLSTRGVQLDPERATGVVDVVVRDGQPAYTIVADQAYDFIDARAAVAAAGDAPLGVLYHGTLAARGATSAAAIAALRRARPAVTFVDLNLRAPWWSEASARAAIDGAAVVKLNDEELRALSGGAAATAPSTAPSTAALLDAAGALRAAAGVGVLIVTRGQRGALVLEGGGVFEAPAAPVGELRDTVGAGDAFSAVWILGLVRGWRTPKTLRRAVELAASVCSLRGAIAEERGFYRRWTERWAEEDAHDG